MYHPRINSSPPENIPAKRVFCKKRQLFHSQGSHREDRRTRYLEPFEQMVARGARKVTLVHVQDKNDLKHHLKKRSAAINALDRSRLENLQQTLLARGVAKVDIAICYGEPFAEITRLARECNAHLVVMGTQGRGFFGKIFLGSVSHNVVRTSVAPVLLIPPVS